MMQISARIPKHPVTRFAPSPTGLLHLGHVASCIFVWGIAGRCGATVLLRSEDHDQTRARRSFETAIFDDLAWLGLVPSNQSLTAQTPSDFRQSDALARYHAKVDLLKKQYLVYGCDCSRQQIAQEMRQHPGAVAPTELRYSGRCRSRGLALDAPGVGWRIAMPDHLQTFDDLLLGTQQQRPAEQCGDLLVRDRHGHFTYHFAVVVDDLCHGVNLVIRGQDLTAATGRQLWLTEALGGDSKGRRYLHHPLITDEHGHKLSKRFLSESLAARRQRGESAEAVLGLAAHLVGLQATPAPLSAAELPLLFALESHV